MKKNLFLLGLAVAAMTSCTNDEVVEVNQSTQKVIGFETFVNKTTRGIIGAVDGTNLKNFWVLAQYGEDADNLTPLYDTPEKVTWDDDEDEWGSASTKYWSNNAYYFIAYADENTSDEAPDYVEITDGGALQITDYILDYDLKDDANDVDPLIPTQSSQKDIVADVLMTQGVMNREASVDFTLEHLLSKIKFTVINNGSFPMSITDLKVTPIHRKGSITINHATNLKSAPTWTLPEEDDDQQVIDIYPIEAKNEIAVGDQVNSADFLVLPQNLTGVKVEIKAQFYSPMGDVIDVKDFTDEKALTLSVAQYANWLPGNFYNYTISLPAAGKQIKFNLTGVTGWNPAAGETTNNDGTKTPNPIELNPNPNPTNDNE